MDKKLLTFRYMTGFECLGADCEDTCCSGLKVAVDEAGYNALKRGLPALQFEDGVRKCDWNEPAFAVLNQNKDGSCRFLQAGLCNVHKHLGQAFLPDPCAVYPRQITEVDGHFELTGAMSCPQVARLALLTDDAMDFVQMDVSDAGRLVPVERLQTTASAYTGHINDVRQFMLDLLAMKTHPIEHRLMWMVSFANATTGFLHKDAPDDVIDRIARAADPLRDAEFRIKLVGAQEERAVPASLALALVHRLIRLGAASDAKPAFRDLIVDVLKSYASDVDPRPGVSEIWSEYQGRRARVIERQRARMDTIFTNYAANYWLQSPFTTSDDLLKHMTRLLLQVAAQRFLLISLRDSRDTLETLDKAAVRVVYTMNRVFEHTNLVDELAQELAKQGVLNDAGAMSLTRF